MRNSDASTRSWTTFASKSRLPTLSAALMASLVFAVALGASGSALAACGGGGGDHPAYGRTGVHATTSTAPSGGTVVHGVSSCGTSNSTITNKVVTTGGLAGVDPNKVVTTGGLAE
jgi:hypothetical protein